MASSPRSSWVGQQENQPEMFQSLRVMCGGALSRWGGQGAPEEEKSLGGREGEKAEPQRKGRALRGTAASHGIGEKASRGEATALE